MEVNLGVVKELGNQGRRHFNWSESKCISNPRFQKGLGHSKLQGGHSGSTVAMNGS